MDRRLTALYQRLTSLVLVHSEDKLDPTHHYSVSFLQITLTSNRYNVALVVLVEEFEIVAGGAELIGVENLGSVFEQLIELLDLWDSFSLSSENDLHAVSCKWGVCE